MSRKLMKDIFINTYKDKVLEYDLQLHKKEIEFEQLPDKLDDYYLELNVVFENEHGKFKLSVPHICLGVDTRRIPIINQECSGFGFEAPRISLGGSPEFLVSKDLKTDSYWTAETLEVYRKKMTLEEVERKLGYAIEIVDDKEEK